VTRHGFIGAGRLARSLALALHAAGEAVAAVASRSDASARELALALQQAGGAATVLTPQALADQVDLIWITSTDAAIAPLTQALRWRAGQAVLHCSGATPLEALSAAQRQGASVGGFHPLQIFSDPGGVSLQGVRVAVEAPEPALHARLQALARQLGMLPLSLPPGARALYHAAAGTAASALLALLDEAQRLWAAAGLPPEQALPALLPLARATLDVAQARGLAGALSGPISRGDAAVLAGHLQALAALPPEHACWYQALGRRQLALARQAGRLSSQQLTELAALLAG
jgi:predicted short-subunit dehydrogenase-like oxidoreductase (DUF2520 family)